MHTTGSRPKLVVSADGHGVVSHAGSRLLADLADATGLTAAFTDALRRLRPRGTGHDPGRIAVDVAVMLADGGEAIADLALLRNQAEVFGPVASTSTAWRLLAGIDHTALAALRTARALVVVCRVVVGRRSRWYLLMSGSAVRGSGGSRRVQRDHLSPHSARGLIGAIAGAVGRVVLGEGASSAGPAPGGEVPPWAGEVGGGVLGVREHAAGGRGHRTAPRHPPHCRKW